MSKEEPHNLRHAYWAPAKKSVFQQAAEMQVRRKTRVEAV